MSDLPFDPDTVARYAAAAPRRQANAQALATIADALRAGDEDAVDRLAATWDDGFGRGAHETITTLHHVHALERIIGDNDLLPMLFIEQARAAARAVGRVVIRTRFGAANGHGSGFLVGPGLLLTNNHVLKSAPVAAKSEVEFGYAVNADGDIGPVHTFGLEPDRLFLTDKALDYTLVAVSATERTGGPPLSSRGWLALSREPIGELARVNLVQHPNGDPQQIALRGNQVVTVLDHACHYRSDTQPGSSGSPVFDDGWQVVALHHSSVPRTDEDGRALTTDGEVWQRGMPTWSIDWVANEGIRIDRILAHVAAAELDEAAAELRASLLSGVASAPVEAVRAQAIAAPEAARMGAPTVRRVGDRLHIHIEVQLPPDAEPSMAPKTPESHRDYYDPAADEARRSAWYGGIDQPDFEALGRRVRTKHTTVLPYKPRAHIYPLVDRQPDGSIVGLYSGQRYDAEVLVARDEAIAHQRLEATQAVLARETDLENALEALTPDLEARLPYNCEHVVPQALFGYERTARGDLHHQFACESRCNSFRGNRIYTDFPDFEAGVEIGADEVVRALYGKVEGGRFEPSGGKGPAARATLYFLLRYPGVVPLDAETLAMLLRWHAEHPVGLWEQHRNAEIEGLQGNRNPLIDFPDWATRIDFTEGLKA